MRLPLPTVLLLSLVLWSAPFRSAGADASAQERTAARLVEALNARDAEALGSMFDLDTLAERVADGVGLSGELRRVQINALRREGARIAINTTRLMDLNHVEARYLKSRSRQRSRSLLLRYDFHDAEGESTGHDYVEFELARDGRVVDVYSHVQGDSVSGQLVTTLALLMPDENIFKRLLGLSDFDPQLLPILKRFGEQQQAGDFAGAYRTLGEVGGRMRDTRLWAELRVGAASQMDEATRAASVAHLFQRFGDDDALQFAFYDHHFNARDFEAAIATMERFERAVIEDGVTNQLKCASANEMQAWARARAYCERSIALDPADEDAWWMLVTSGLGARDATLVLSTLEGIEQRFEKYFDPDRLIEIEEYAWLKSLPEFKKWRAKRRV